MIKKLKNQKGATSIIWVIVIFLSVLIVSGFIGIINRTMVINEVQGTMDMSGVMALRYALDEFNLRSDESLLIDTKVAEKKYRDLVENNLKDYVGENKMIKSYDIQSVTVLRDDKTALGGGGVQGSKAGSEYFLESVITVDYGVSGFIDGATVHVVNYFDFLWSGEQASVAIADDKGDGEGNLVIRTVSRLAIR